MGTCQISPGSHTLTLEALRSSLQQYATKNNLIQFNKSTREVIEKLFVLNQSHVSDKLIELFIAKNFIQYYEMLADLERLNLEEFDEICFISKVSQQNCHYNNSLLDKRKVQIANSRQLKAEKKSQLLKGPVKLLFIIPYISFSNNEVDILENTNLLSKKSRLQLFIEKIEGLKEVQRQWEVKIAIICPKKQASLIQSLHYESIHVIAFEPNSPCFSSDNKIVLYGNKIQFNERDGDLIHYIFTESSLKGSHINFDFIIFNDLNNIAAPALNPVYLNYLKDSCTSFLVTVSPNSTTDIYEINGFIQIPDQKIGDIIIKTKILKEVIDKQTEEYYQINSRIKRKKMENLENCFYFSRLPSNILLSSQTKLVKMPMQAYDCCTYSNLCKAILGIQNVNESDIVQISPSVLHGSSSQLTSIREKLISKSQQYGYPIIITKSINQT